jgi:uncharacterized SAM-binding protein YcdF (DUF218 family)
MLSILLALTAAAILFRARKGLALLPIVLLFLWTWPPAAMLFSRTLEWRYPDNAFPLGDAQAIVVLGGSAFPASPQPEAVPGAATYLRCRYAAWLYKNWKPLPVIASGGPAGSFGSLADVMRSVLIAEGVPADRIRLERESRSTFENAAFTSARLLPDGIRAIALVTDAHHMLRAERSFRKQGFSVVPAPCAFRSLRLDDTLLPSARAAQHNDEALHEWIGIAAYRLTGKL